MSKKIVVANWKMYPETLAEAKRIFVELKKHIGRLKGVEIVICPPAVFLPELRKFYIGKKLTFGAQDMFWETHGAHTGELSPTQLMSAGATHVIIGHSERRARGETDEEVHKKVHAALAAKLTVIVCVGEQARDHHGGYLHVLTQQLQKALHGIPSGSLKKIAIAYEPIWAIGKTSRDAMKPDDLHGTVLFIRKILSEMYDQKSAFGVPILYGGSVEAENTSELLSRGDVRGFLVGHASLDPKEFLSILQLASGAK